MLAPAIIRARARQRNRFLLRLGLLATSDDSGLDPLAPPQGGVMFSLAPSFEVAKSPG